MSEDRTAAEGITTEQRARLLDLAGDAIVVRDARGGVLFWSAGAERVYGWPASEALGRDLDALLETRLPGSLERATARLFETGSWEGELGRTRRDGSTMLAAARWLVRQDAGRTTVVEISSDLTEARAAEEALRSSEARFRGVFASAPVGMALCDLAGAVTDANPALARLLGTAEEDLRGRPIRAMAHPEDAEIEAELFGQLAAGRRRDYRLEERLLLPSGAVLPVRLTGSLVEDAAGEPSFAVVMVEDLSLAFIDELTGLPNRRAFVFFGQQQAKVAYRERRPLVLLYVDVEQMRAINDTHGPQEGDRALLDTARVLGETFRSSDFVSRIGGDEFCVLLSGLSQEPEPAIVRLQDAVAAWNRRMGRVYELGLSVGWARSSSERPRSVDDLIAEAGRDAVRHRVGGTA